MVSAVGACVCVLVSNVYVRRLTVSNLCFESESQIFIDNTNSFSAITRTHHVLVPI